MGRTHFPAWSVKHRQVSDKPNYQQPVIKPQNSSAKIPLTSFNIDVWRLLSRRSERMIFRAEERKRCASLILGCVCSVSGREISLLRPKRWTWDGESLDKQQDRRLQSHFILLHIKLTCQHVVWRRMALSRCVWEGSPPLLSRIIHWPSVSRWKTASAFVWGKWIWCGGLLSRLLRERGRWKRWQWRHFVTIVCQDKVCFFYVKVQNENVHQFFNLMPSQAHDFISSDELKDFYIKLLSFWYWTSNLMSSSVSCDEISSHEAHKWDLKLSTCRQI